MNRDTVPTTLAMLLLAGTIACAVDDGGGPNEESEIITTVTLTFTPSGGGAAITASFEDPDGDGGMSGTTDPLALAVGTTYAMTVSFANALASPPEDITAEVEEEAQEHQVFVYGGAVAGPAAGTNAGALVQHAYADSESSYGENTGDDLPVGLQNTMTVGATAGTGELTIMLRHLPELNDQPQKVAGLAEDHAAGTPLPGEVDALVTFDLTVQ